MVEAVRWLGDTLLLLDQRLLPERAEYVTCKRAGEVAQAISTMVVRGAPAIGIAAAYGLVLEARWAGNERIEIASFESVLRASADLLKASRPTAVNLEWAVNRVLTRAHEVLRNGGTVADCVATMEQEAVTLHRKDVEANRRIGEYGAQLIPVGSGVLTHCNAGALATGGYGTALGLIREAWKAGRITMVFVDETRPVLQGARLTAWELMQDGIPVTLLVDSAAGYLMATGKVSAVVVGADRIARNGDFANKIGTYALACLAARHHIPFYVAAPSSSIDPLAESGDSIPIEERHPEEVTHIGGRRVAPSGVRVWNPAFDVTPSSLVSAIITEEGVFRAPYDFRVGSAQ